MIDMKTSNGDMCSHSSKNRSVVLRLPLDPVPLFD